MGTGISEWLSEIWVVSVEEEELDSSVVVELVISLEELLLEGGVGVVRQALKNNNRNNNDNESRFIFIIPFYSLYFFSFLIKNNMV